MSTVWHGTLGHEPWQPQDPVIQNRIGPLWRKFFESLEIEFPKQYSIKIGGETYTPYQYAYDKTLKDYVWKFKRGDTLA